MPLPFFGKSKKEIAIDPVCKMEVDVKNPPGGSFAFKGSTYYFCAPGCKRSFEKEPEKYLSGAGGSGRM